MFGSFTAKEPFNHHGKHRHDGHGPIIDFFRLHGFGTIPPVLTALSVLAPTDRCVILEALFDPAQLNSILSDKLLLAYVTSGRQDLAYLVIDNARLNGENAMNLAGLESKAELGLAPQRNRAQRVELFDRWLQSASSDEERSFLHLLIDFSNRYYQ